MKKIITATLLSVLSFSAFTSERIVVSFYENKDAMVQSQSIASSKKEQCFDLQNQNSWCVPVPSTLQSYVVNTQSIQKHNLTIKSVSVVKPAELSFEQAFSLLENTGFYVAIESDYKIKSNWNTTIPNDPVFNVQHQFLTHNSENKTASSVLDMWGMIKNPTKNIEVYVLDSGFRLNEDLNYAKGFNFTLTKDGHERGVGFLENDYNDETCTDHHGVMTSSVIGAEINNGQDMSGMVGNVTINPIRVMDCGRGWLLDAADALSWLSNETVEDVPDFEGTAGVVNMSLSGDVGGACPFYLQNVVDKAISKGFVLVASAGNDFVDVTNIAPANCKGVITVGAMNDTNYFGTPVADIAYFSNYGREIDITAQGINVMALHNSYGVIGVNGTSFSAPIVSALIALAQKDFTLSPEEWLNLVSISGIKSWDVGSQCELLGCGGGVLDGVKLYEKTVKYLNGELNSMDYSLNALSSCNQQFVVKNIESKAEACDKITVFLDGFNEEEGVLFKLYTVDEGLVINDSNKSLLAESTRAELSISRNAITNKTVYVQSCTMDFGCGKLFEVNSSKLAELPSICL